MSNEQEKATFNGGGEGTIKPNEQATGQSSGSLPTAIVSVPNSVSSSLQPDKFLVEIEPTLPPGNTDPTVLASVEQWNHGDYLCKGQILHYLVDKLYNVYSEVSTSKILWEKLETQFKVFNVGSGKFTTANFLNYKMVDSRPIMDQVNELQLIFHGIADEGMKICETFTVNSIVEKLPLSWEAFKNYLEFKQKPLSLQNLIARLQNEATKRVKSRFIATHDANMAEYKRKCKAKVVYNNKGTAPPNKGGNNKIVPQPSTSFKKQGEQGEFKKSSVKCTFCHKKGDLCAVVTEANVVMTNESPLEWWYDTGATTHICINRDMFTTYQKCKSGEKLMTGNVSHSKIEGTDKVVLKLTSGMSVTLTNVKHVPDMRKNLISGTLMNKHGFAINLESELILRKNGVFIGKGFVKGESGLAQNLWGEALLTTNHILNKIPHKVTGNTSHKLWKGTAPSYKYLKVWGCLAKVTVPPPKKVTIGPKTVDCIFIGYARNSSAYRFLVHKSDIPDIHVNTIMESRNASFFEHIFPCKDKQNLKRTRDERDVSTAANEASTSGTSNQAEDEPRRIKRACKEKSFGEDFLMVFSQRTNQEHMLNQCLYQTYLYGRKPLIVRSIPLCKIIHGK
ncbi:hypothetical protein ISN44_As12g032490 [Arabidopsis suecica]|uniref:Uncharacterized protein n=1 Tax=Arabidopsis suecica TaxID=45249 RepID=A0A8T1YP72_ARASU|nr:hypothetical protein ISN44_As12g032490 [Arabidopsis suecica]